jgi:hypothetical protein
MKKTEPEFDIGYEGHQTRQARLGLELTPAQRLAWLDNKLLEMRSLLGRARSAEPDPSPPAAPRSRRG